MLWNHRTTARLLMLVISSAMIFNAMPAKWPLLVQPRQWLNAGMNRIGLWQGEWSMFAPNPSINNGWMSATITLPGSEGEQTTEWNSPHWSQASTWDKFIGFRNLNYFNRLALPWYIMATKDLVAFVARQYDVPTANVKLYRNHLRLQMPEDGSLPTPEEAVWQFLSEPWTAAEPSQPGSES